jgi:hypothetical protein
MKYLVILMIFLLLTSFKLENENNKSTIYIIRPSVVGFAVKLATGNCAKNKNGRIM